MIESLIVGFISIITCYIIINFFIPKAKKVELNKINLAIKNKDHFDKVFYAGSHDACLLAVLNNQSDVCGMSSRNFEARLKDKTFSLDQVRIIHKSSPVPPPPLAYSKNIPLEDRNKIKKAVLEAHKHGAIGGYGGKMSHYIEVKDSEEAESIKKALRTNKFKDLLPALVLSNFQVSYKILSLLRKDFIEEF